MTAKAPDKWTGYVLSWNPKFIWGKEQPCPHKVYFTCYADSEQEASLRLHRKASCQGYALGGVRDIMKVQEGK